MPKNAYIYVGRQINGQHLMYRLVFILFLFVACKPAVKHAIIAKKVNHETLIDGEKVNDTDLISADADKEGAIFVYIEHNRQAPIYQGALNFEPDSNEKSEYRANYLEAKKAIASRFKKFELHDLPRQWVPLYLYKGEYYLYAPSEWGNLDRRTITDSTLVYWPMDGPTPEPILAFDQPNSNTYNVKTHSPYDYHSSNLTIHIIDSKNELAIWEYHSTNGDSQYSLFVPLANAKNFDMIVNYCKQHKTGEFEFDKIDYPGLLKAANYISH